MLNTDRVTSKLQEFANMNGVQPSLKQVTEKLLLALRE